MSIVKQIFGVAYARHLDGDAPTTGATVSGFYPTPYRLRCMCGGEAEQHFRLDRLGDGSARLVCRRCSAELATITADLMTLE
jgi:predicted SprT family Zn-dependent metalloprotease